MHLCFGRVESRQSIIFPFTAYLCALCTRYTYTISDVVSPSRSAVAFRFVHPVSLDIVRLASLNYPSIGWWRTVSRPLRNSRCYYYAFALRFKIALLSSRARDIDFLEHGQLEIRNEAAALFRFNDVSRTIVIENIDSLPIISFPSLTILPSPYRYLVLGIYFLRLTTQPSTS